MTENTGYSLLQAKEDMKKVNDEVNRLGAQNLAQQSLINFLIWVVANPGKDSKAAISQWFAKSKPALDAMDPVFQRHVVESLNSGAFPLINEMDHPAPIGFKDPTNTTP